MTEKENNLINELGLDKNPSVSLNVCGTGASSKESSDSEVISSDEPSSLFAFFEEAEKNSSKSLSLTINQMPDTSQFSLYELRHGLKKVTLLNSLTLAVNIYSDIDSLWAYELGKALAESTSLNSLTLAINTYSDTDSLWADELGKALAESTSLNSVTLAINIYSDSDSDTDSDSDSDSDTDSGTGSGPGSGPGSHIDSNIDIYSDSDSQWGHEFLYSLEKIKSLPECNFTFNICGKCKPDLL